MSFNDFILVIFYLSVARNGNQPSGPAPNSSAFMLLVETEQAEQKTSSCRRDADYRRDDRSRQRRLPGCRCRLNRAIAPKVSCDGSKAAVEGVMKKYFYCCLTGACLLVLGACASDGPQTTTNETSRSPSASTRDLSSQPQNSTMNRPMAGPR
jgi:hypothetical protein